MDAILADWYWHYFQQNRWRFMQRMATSAPPGKDFTTWDLPRIFAEIGKQFAKALAPEAELKAISVRAYGELLHPVRCPTPGGRRCTTSSPTRPWTSTPRASKRQPSRRTPSSYRPRVPSSHRPKSL